ncbi:MAG TPA: transcriptional regulator, partial [Verrucomicrobiales bacterium]|nr:transcriptional regulator [Verrucomicrobiales bacterium]
KSFKNYQKPGRKKSSSKSKVVDPHITAIQNRLRDHFATQTVIHHTDKKGRIEIEYYGNDDLGRILNLLGLDLD